MSLYHKLDPVIMRHDKLSPQSKLVYYALVTFWNEKTKKCFPKMKTISSLTGLSYSTVRRSIVELARLKVIIVHRLRSTQSYTLPLQNKMCLTEHSDVPHRHNNKLDIYNYNTRYKNFSKNPTEFNPRSPIPLDDKYLVKFKPIGIEGEFVCVEERVSGKRFKIHRFKKQEPIPD
jgi:hypothetical protein